MCVCACGVCVCCVCHLLNIWGVFLLRTVASTTKFRAALNRHQLPLGDFGVESFTTRIFILPQKLPYTKRSVSPPSFIAVKLGNLQPSHQVPRALPYKLPSAHSGSYLRDRVPHTEILKKTNCRSIEAMITQRQLQWLGHVIRMPPCRLPRRVL